MRELGVIYNSSYYSISEHPGYQRAAGGDHAEVSVAFDLVLISGPSMTFLSSSDMNL